SGEDHLSHWRWMAALGIRLADVVIVPSGYLVDVFARFGLRARAIFNIARLEENRFWGREPFSPIFFTTHLHESLYNLPCAPVAFALIQRRYPEDRFTMGGDGWQRRRLEQLARDRKLRTMIFMGRIPFDQMPVVYDTHDVYLTATDIDN